MADLINVCPKEISIYHVFGHKVGSTSNLHQRMRSQSIKEGAYEVLAVLPANELTYREVWETEQDYAVTKGFEPEHEGNWFHFLQSHTNNPMFGKTHSNETKAKMSATMSDGRMAGENSPNFGKVLSKEHRAKISQTNSRPRPAQIGKNNPKAKLANLYINGTDELVAERINIAEWCREKGYGQANLSATARADRSQPSSSANKHHAKGIYARYLEVV